LGPQQKHSKVVIDLKASPAGLRRCVTRSRAKRYRCARCWNTFLPAEDLAVSSKYGAGLCAWVVYPSISLRQSNDAVAEALGELFGVRLEGLRL
jgi:hypothetical protein